jgi:hypothetical protein
VGIFWVSHAGSDSNPEDEGARWDDVVLDIYGNDVKEVFQRVHPNIRWLSVIGCNAQPIFDAYRKHGYYSSRLTIQSFNSKVDAIRGLTFALNESATVLGDPMQSWTYLDGDSADAEGRHWSRVPVVVARKDLLERGAQFICESKQGFPIRAYQTVSQSPNETSEIELLRDGEFLGLVPPKGDLTFYLGPSSFSFQTRLKIQARWIRHGAADSARPHFEVHFDSSLRAQDWNVFADAAGNPIGTWTHLYRFNGSLEPAQSGQEAVDYQPFQCEPVRHTSTLLNYAN